MNIIFIIYINIDTPGPLGLYVTANTIRTYKLELRIAFLYNTDCLFMYVSSKY